METLTIDKVKIMRGDCMDYLRSLPDKAFDLAVVDPPYGGGNQQDCALRNGGGVVQPIQAKSYEKRYGGIFNKYKRTLPRPLQGDVRDTIENYPPHNVLTIKHIQSAVFGGILLPMRNTSKNYFASVSTKLFGAAITSTYHLRAAS